MKFGEFTNAYSELLTFFTNLEYAVMPDIE